MNKHIQVDAVRAALLAAPAVPTEEQTTNEHEGEEPTRRCALVPAPLELGDMQMLRWLASWRFANPAALAALSWPARSAHGQEWRMRRFVDCKMLGRRMLKSAQRRHVVFARTMALELAIRPPPAHELLVPRWSESAGRQGWMRSTVAAAYLQAGWSYQLADTVGSIVTEMRSPETATLTEATLAQVFPDGAQTYPFDLAMKRRRDGRPIIHILLVDDSTSAPPRLLNRLPYDNQRSTRIGVRFFPVDDHTFWSRNEQRYRLTSHRAEAFLKFLHESRLSAIPVEYAGPEVAPWGVMP